MKKTFLDTEISVYNGVTDTKGSISTLGTFLNDTKHIDEIKRLRTLTNKDERNTIKKRLPMAAYPVYSSHHGKRRILNSIRGLSAWI